MENNFVECESSIIKVDVYARGAVITRRVELPVSVPSEACTLTISGVSNQFETGSLRTKVDGERQISSLRTRLFKPEDIQSDPISLVALEKLEQERNRNYKQIERVQKQIDLFEGMSLNQDLLARSKNAPAPNVAERFSTALKVNDTIDARLRALYTEMRARRSTERDIQKRTEEADSQPKAIRRRPVQQVLIGIAEGSEHLRALEVSYSVESARWWPAYSVRLSEGGQRAAFALEAFVAQQSGENWKNVEISLCTADMIQDIRLPVLDSLRYGRKQDAPRSGYREPPEGLDSLFSNFDSYMESIPGRAREQFIGSSTTARGQTLEVDSVADDDYDDDWDEGLADEESEESCLDDIVMARGAVAELSAPPPAPIAAPSPAPIASQAAPEVSKKRSKAAPSRRSGNVMPEEAVMLDAFGSAPGGGLGSSFESPKEPEASTNEEWLDFDQLLLGGAGDGSHRGRLSRLPTGAGGDGGGLNTPDNTSDPMYSRGMFDHRFTADGVVDIPANGQVHRIQLRTQNAPSEMNFRCAPRVDERVFREVALTNPFEAPLLPGPVDVFIDGTLVMSSKIDGVDRGGNVNFGIGEEQRLRVARNTKVHEESKGLLGGKSEIDHTVSIDIASSLGVDVVVEVIGRIPVSGDDKIDVSLLRSKPDAEKYDQRDRDQYVEGGLRWKLPVPAGGKSSIEYEYRIVLPAGYELNGGNRRE
ncbi:MAG: DUF4139 domain-containing protein [Planctomycetes bacterium]|nr:DUF4139 domain-containing protein [Planctomycetota bacterium]